MSDSLRPVDCSPPSSSVHGILQARILEWVAISFSRGSSQPRDRTQGIFPTQGSPTLQADALTSAPKCVHFPLDITKYFAFMFPFAPNLPNMHPGIFLFSQTINFACLGYAFFNNMLLDLLKYLPPCFIFYYIMVYSQQCQPVKPRTCFSGLLMSNGESALFRTFTSCLKCKDRSPP